MTTKKQYHSYCRIIDYINQHDRALADIIAGQCNVGLLSTGKSKTGITFLYPTDKALIAKLDKAAYSGNADDHNLVATIINAHIIKDNLKTVADWNAHKEDLPNALGQHVAIRSASGDEVVFESGARATIDKRFIDASESRNISVWTLTGEIPVTTDKPATEKFLRETLKSKRGAKRGGYEVDAEHGSTLRYQIALAAENTYTIAQSTHMKSPMSVFQSYALSLIGFIANVYSGPDRDEIMSLVAPLYTHHNVDFYFLIQPHEKPHSKFMLPTRLIEQWWNAPNRDANGGAIALGLIKKYLSGGESGLVMSVEGRIQINGAVGKARSELVHIRDRGLLRQLVSVYQQLESKNVISNVAGIYNDSLAQFYSENRGLKMMQDGLRFVTHDMFRSLEMEPEFDQGYYRDLLAIIGTALHTNSESERLRVLGIFNECAIQYSVNPSDSIATINTFIQSTCFLQMAQTSESMPQYNRSQLFRPKPLEKTVYNIDAAIALKHERLLANPGPTHTDLLARLRALDPNTIDPALKQELAKFA